MFTSYSSGRSLQRPVENIFFFQTIKFPFFFLHFLGAILAFLDLDP